MPAVCSALGGIKLREQAGAVLTARTGPPNGSNVFFTFALGSVSKADETPSTPSLRRERAIRASSAPSNALHLANALVLVSCAKTKLLRPAEARDLYVSPFFRMVRRLIEREGADWKILSAKHGLLRPETVIAPYEQTLNLMAVAERKRWASGILRALSETSPNYERIVIFAGQRYREFLMGPLAAGGRNVEIPLEGLRQGEQLAWLTRQ